MSPKEIIRKIREGPYEKTATKENLEMLQKKMETRINALEVRIRKLEPRQR